MRPTMGCPDYVYTPRSAESCERQRQSMLRKLGIPEGFRRVYGVHVPVERSAFVREHAAKISAKRGFKVAQMFVVQMLCIDNAPGLIPILCPHCAKVTMKPLSHVRRSRKLGMNLYCNRECSTGARHHALPKRVNKHRKAHREAHREREQKRRAGPHRDRIIAAQRAAYLRNREANLQRQKEYRERNREAFYAGIKRWFNENPDKRILHAAKTTIAREMGIKFAEVPTDLAEARVSLWLVKRAIKDLDKSSKS